MLTKGTQEFIEHLTAISEDEDRELISVLYMKESKSYEITYYQNTEMPDGIHKFAYVESFNEYGFSGLRAR